MDDRKCTVKATNLIGAIGGTQCVYFYTNVYRRI